MAYLAKHLVCTKIFGCLTSNNDLTKYSQLTCIELITKALGESKTNSLKGLDIKEIRTKCQYGLAPNDAI